MLVAISIVLAMVRNIGSQRSHDIIPIALCPIEHASTKKDVASKKKRTRASTEW